VKFRVLPATSMKMTAFENIEPCTFDKVDRHFRGAYCIHQSGCPDVTTRLYVPEGCELCNLKVDFYIHKSPLLVPILSEINPAHTVLKIRFNIILNSLLFPSCSPTKFFTNLPHASYTPRPPHSP
jgi:hypothetical protein